MPRVHYRKARKDYPDHGIAKGDMYYTCKIKTGPRSGRTLRSKTPFKQSQLTQSPFKSGWFAMEEGWQDGAKSPDEIREAAEAIREIGQEAQDSYDNMPEGLQEGDTGQLLYARAEGCEEKADELEGLADELDGLEEPDEVPEPEHEEQDREDDQGWEEWQTYQDDLATYEAEVERIRDEADGIIGDMPDA